MDFDYRQPAIPYGWLRAILFLIVWLLGIAFIQVIGLFLIDVIDGSSALSKNNLLGSIAGWSLMLVYTIFLTFFFRKSIDRQSFNSLGFWVTERKHDLLTGFLLGAILIAGGAFYLGQSDHIEFSPGSLDWKGIIGYLVFFLLVSVFEELVFRGYILNNLMQSMNKYAALALNAIPFGLIHATNPNVETLGIVNVILAGFFLGATYIYTKNLWFPIGLHWSWNFFQGPIFGFEVSGNPTDSVLAQEVLENNIQTGGDFGFEASIITTFMLVITTFVLMFLFSRKSVHGQKILGDD
ncbi:MAG: CPBP family intramembrane metalloprotease [Saprospiraceae bacterium]|nr:CPBP family intramembrane metalloprotease [Saprospiraceae bacterium]